MIDVLVPCFKTRDCERAYAILADLILRISLLSPELDKSKDGDRFFQASLLLRLLSSMSCTLNSSSGLQVSGSINWTLNEAAFLLCISLSPHAAPLSVEKLPIFGTAIVTWPINRDFCAGHADPVHDRSAENRANCIVSSAGSCMLHETYIQLMDTR